jgi:hypothetical protein
MDNIEIIKEKISKFYLELAGKLPRFQGGWVARLQSAREMQIKDAEECLKNTKKPEGNDLAFHGLNLYEVYLLEDFNRLRKEFDRIYTYSSKRSFHTERYISQYNDFIDRSLKGFFHGGWSNLGIVVPEGDPRKYYGATRIEGFPEEIELVAIELFQILPSVIIVKFDVKFRNEVINKLDSLIDNRCYGKTIFSSIFPWRYGYRHNSADSEKTAIIRNYFISLQIIAENFLRGYFKGYFLSQAKKIVKPVCPAVGIFSISDLPIAEEELDTKMKKEHWFWNTVGFTWYDKFNIFKSGEMFFFACSYSLDRASYPFRILIKKKNLKINGFGDIENAIDYEVSDFLRGYVHPIVLLELFKRILNQVNAFRITIGKRIFSKSILRPRLSRLLKLDQIVTEERFIFNRLLSDYNHIKSFGHLGYDVTPAASLKDNSFPSIESKKLFDSLLKEIDIYISLTKEQYDTLNTGFKDYLSVKNLQVSYKLQSRIFWLTILLLFIGIVQLFPEVKQHIFSFFSNIVFLLRKQ